MKFVLLIALVLAALYVVGVVKTGAWRELVGGTRKRLRGELTPAQVAALEHETLPARSVREWGHGNECVACRPAPVPPKGDAGVSTIIPRNRRSTYDCQLHGHEYRLDSYDCIICGK